MSTSEEKYVDKAVGILVLEKGETEDGQQFWALLSIRPSAYDSFVEAKKQSGYVLTDYGDVLRYRMGMAEPTPAELKQMGDDFGFQA